MMPPAGGGGERVPAPKKMKAGAYLNVTLPADAILTIDGHKTKSTSEFRTFVTPPLEPGWNYQYQLRAEIDRDGQHRVLTQKVTVRPGEDTRVDMTDFTNAQVENSQSSQ
jgi:uncharacterized protein (TIGR03000 family)